MEKVQRQTSQWADSWNGGGVSMASRRLLGARPDPERLRGGRIGPGDLPASGRSEPKKAMGAEEANLGVAEDED